MCFEIFVVAYYFQVNKRKIKLSWLEVVKIFIFGIFYVFEK